MSSDIKPIKRGKFRIMLGKQYYRIKRYFEWYMGNKKYAREHRKENLDYIVTKHKTPLYRKLKNVDMELQENKVKNLEIASYKLSKIIIKPGETFSYWKLIGKPTKRKGYLEGMILYYGKIDRGIGGGLCQLSNLIYWMALHTPLKVTERYRHSYDVFPDSNRTQPFGSGATCVYNYRDLQIFNGTEENYQINIHIRDGYLVGEIRSDSQKIYNYRIYEKEHKISHEYWGGYVRHNLIYRKVFDYTNKLKKDEYITENHAIMMYNPFLEGDENEEKKLS